MKISAGSIHYVILILIDVIIGSPVSKRTERELVFMPMQVPGTRMVQAVPLPLNPPYYYQTYPHLQQSSPNTQLRGPFDFIGQWIQQTPWLPIHVNVPDIFQNIGNGITQGTNTVQQFAQNVGNGVSQFGQNVGNGFNQFTQNVGSGFNNWMQQLSQRVPIIFNRFPGNKITAGTNNGQPQQVVMVVPIEYPGGQQLVLANEAIEAYP